VTPNLIVHPDVTGMGPLRQWILDHVDDEVVVMLDDDVKAVYSQTGIRKRRIEDENSLMRVLENCAEITAGLGTCVWGYTQHSGRPAAYKPMDPFKLNTWAGAVIGFVGRPIRYDTNLLLRADVDFFLKAMLKFRIVFIDTRFDWSHIRFAGTGGNAANRSYDRTMEEIKYLQKRWGKYLALSETRALNIGTRVPRKQK